MQERQKLVDLRLEDENQSVRLSKEHTAFAWVSKDQPSDYLESDDPIRAAAEKALEHPTSGIGSWRK